MIDYLVEYTSVNDGLGERIITAERISESDNLLSFYDKKNAPVFVLPTKRLISIKRLED